MTLASASQRNNASLVLAEPRQAAQKVRPFEQQINDDDLRFRFHKDDEVLPAPGKAKVFGEIRINQAAAIPSLRQTCSDVPVAGHEVLSTGLR